MGKGQADWNAPGLDPLCLFAVPFLLSGWLCTHQLYGTHSPQGNFILGLRIFDEPEVGDIIVFEKNGELLIKRIAAGSGD